MEAFKFFIFITLIFLNLFLDAQSTRAEVDNPCQNVVKLLALHYSGETLQNEILQSLGKERQQLQARGLEDAYCSELIKDLEDKFSTKKSELHLSSEDIIQHAILFESFRLDRYLSSAVVPKRYFGFFDEQGDTADYEKILRNTIIEAVRITNEHALTLGLKSRITEKEVAITFLAEGGALLLTNPEYSPNKVHPVRGIGLDNFRLGFQRYPALITQFDNVFGTKLNNLIRQSILLRPMTFREAILGTTLMYLFEKELTASLMKEQWGIELMTLSLSQQFIITSLVYNSGILFSRERMEQIESFATGEYLAKINLESKRPKLAVSSPKESEQKLKENLSIPQQLTSWNAVYHILQRYGAWVALEKFSKIFQEGDFVK